MPNKHGLIRYSQGIQSAGPINTPPVMTVSPPRCDAGFNWDRAFLILQRHWRISLAFAAAVVVSFTILAFTMQPIYEPKAHIEIDPPGSEVFSTQPNPNSATSEQNYLDTQVEILKSDELALAVIQALQLDQNPEFVIQGKLHQLLRATAQLLHLKRTTLEDNQDTALEVFSNKLSVYQVRNSRLVEVGFASRDPKLAADVTNTLVDHFIDRNYRTRYGTTMQAAEWLSQELGELRKRIEKSNRALADFQNSNGIVDIDEKQNTVTQKVAELNRQLVQAQADRIQTEAYLRMAETGSADTLPQIHENQLIQSLTQRFVESRAQLAQALAVYGENNPNARKLQSEADEVQAQLAKEHDRALGQLKSSYESARAREALLEQTLDEMGGVIGKMNTKVVQYNFLKKAVRADEDLYNTLFARLEGAGITAGLKSSNLLVIDRARILTNPTGRHRLQVIALGLLLGILGGMAFPFLKEGLNQTIHTTDDIKNWMGLAAMGTIPLIPAAASDGHQLPFPLGAIKLWQIGRKSEQSALALGFLSERPHSAESEAVRKLYSYIKLSHPDKPPRIVLVTSPSPKEGKTTVAVNLAMACAQHGSTCLIDADLRQPMVARVFGLPTQHGLSDVLEGSVPLQTVLQTVPGFENLSILPGGPGAPNPGELVASAPMQEVVRTVAKLFKNVIIDSPPVIPFADAQVLSRLADGVVVVGLCGSTTREAIMLGTEILEEVHAPILGVLLNGADRSSPYYRYYY